MGSRKTMSSERDFVAQTTPRTYLGSTTDSQEIADMAAFLLRLFREKQAADSKARNVQVNTN